MNFRHLVIAMLCLLVSLSACQKTAHCLTDAETLFHQAEEQYAAKQTHEAAESLNQALLLLEGGPQNNKEVQRLKAQTQDLLGTVYWKHDLYDDALNLHLQAIATLRQGDEKYLLSKALRNAGRVSNTLGQPAKAQAYYDEALYLARQLQAQGQLPDPNYLNEMRLEIANDLNLESGDCENAIKIATEALANGGDPSFGNLIIGLANYYLENDSLAIIHLKQSTNAEKPAIRASAYQALCLLSKEQGDFEQSLAYYELYDESKTLTDNQYRQEEMQRIKSEYDLQLQKAALESSQRIKTLFLYLSLALLVFLLVFSFLFYRQKTLRVQLKSEEMKNQLEASLKKNKVFVTALALSEQVTASTLDFNLSQSDWNDYVELTDLVHGGFTQRLLAKYPTLTQRDLQICCLTKQGFGNQVISILMNLQTDSFARQKSRIKRGKMNEAADDRSFEDIINEI